MKLIKDDRMRHMHGVAEFMFEHADDYGLQPERMYILGLLHDVGYMINNEQHELCGSSYLDLLGYVDSDFIRSHGLTPKEYMNFHRCMEDEIPKEMILLWEADLSIDIGGKQVDMLERLNGIKKRRGDKVYNKAFETYQFITKYKLENKL